MEPIFSIIILILIIIFILSPSKNSKHSKKFGDGIFSDSDNIWWSKDLDNKE